MKKKHTILLVNDDGIFSPGLRFLIKICKKIGKVLVVAPEQNQSGMSHAITVDKEIKINKLESSKDYEEYSCSGTPVDCVKIATKKILKKKPDLCISGINHGANYSISTLYSATLHAAVEGTIEGIPSIAISHLDYSSKIDFSSYDNFLENLIRKILSSHLIKGVTLNINIPSITCKDLRGIKVCRQGKGKWIEKINSKKNKFIITGHFESQDKSKDTDIWALDNSFVSVVPIQIDMTDYDYIDNYNDLDDVFQIR
ncbi:MAG: 5'/3'-nucleotidase SurE [Flavobacteriales bacterium]|nr:5'/3'-nucleotidase SurE [Flavobacteriales bacterium]